MFDLRYLRVPQHKINGREIVLFDLIKIQSTFDFNVNFIDFIENATDSFHFDGSRSS